MSIIGHIIGIDEIHKNKLRRQLPSNIKMVDLDVIQQNVYNHGDVSNKKMAWSEITKTIMVDRRQK